VAEQLPRVVIYAVGRLARSVIRAHRPHAGSDRAMLHILAIGS
jgi:hypothetical protein